MILNKKFRKKFTSYLKENHLLSYEKYSKFDISNPFIHVFSYINVTISRTFFIRCSVDCHTEENISTEAKPRSTMLSNG